MRVRRGEGWKGIFSYSQEWGKKYGDNLFIELMIVPRRELEVALVIVGI